MDTAPEPRARHSFIHSFTQCDGDQPAVQLAAAALPMPMKRLIFRPPDVSPEGLKFYQ